MEAAMVRGGAIGGFRNHRGAHREAAIRTVLAGTFVVAQPTFGAFEGMIVGPAHGAAGAVIRGNMDDLL
jgi:hypothetical protein